MTLNATIFPTLPLRTIERDFTTLIVGDDGTPEPGRPAMDLYCDLLDAQVDAQPAWRHPRRLVVAHSFGGMLALSWLLRHGGREPGRIDGLVLIATTAGPMYDAVRLRLARIGPVDLRIGMARWVGAWNAPVVTRSVKRLLSRGRLTATPVDFRALEGTSDAALDLAGWRNTDWRAMRTYRVAMTGFDVRHRLDEIDVPTIVLHGSEDTIFPPDVGRRLARGLPRAEFRLVEGAAHGLPLTHGTQVVAAVEDLLGD